MNSTETKLAEGDPEFRRFYLGLIDLAQRGRQEVEGAAIVYSFAMAFEEGKTAAEAWKDYQDWMNPRIPKRARL